MGESGPKQEHMENVCFMGQLGPSVWPDSQLVAASSSDCASGILLHLQTKAASNVSDPVAALTLDLSDPPTAETEAAPEPAEGHALLAGRGGGRRVQRGGGEGPGPG